jgi:CheY-like chemotaxis protein
LNLAANGRDAMPRGGRLTIRASNTTFRGDEPCDGGEITEGPYVTLVVSDTGKGMDPEVRAHVFDRFFTTKEQGGTGLGLATAHRFVTKNGGAISVKSSPSEGTTITIHLPCVESAPLGTPPSAPRPELPRGDETILVVEDDEHVRRVVRAVLEEQGYTVLDAASAESSVARAKEHTGPIHLLLADVVLANAASGRAVPDVLRAAGFEPKVLFMSGHTEKALVDHGFSDDEQLLRKAFSPTELARRVRDVLDS